MQLSVIIITRNEAPRLRLCLASVHESLKALGRSNGEVLVVNDGSTDSTDHVATEAQSLFPLRVITNHESQGRSRARNIGATHSSGSTLLFLDGDTIVAPSCFTRHVEAHHANKTPSIFRGEVFHFRHTRFLRDPQTGEPFPDYLDRPASPNELITEHNVRTEFATLSERAMPGIYPGIAPRTLANLEVSALRNNPLNHPLWMTATAHNLSMGRTDFHAVGGFDERLDMNEHRDLALTLYEHHGIPVRLVEDAPSYHLCHASRWRDPLEIRQNWEPLFLRKHTSQEARLLTFFWMTLAEDGRLPEHLRIPTIEALIETAKSDISPFENFRAASTTLVS